MVISHDMGYIITNCRNDTWIYLVEVKMEYTTFETFFRTLITSTFIYFLISHDVARSILALTMIKLIAGIVAIVSTIAVIWLFEKPEWLTAEFIMGVYNGS